MTHLPVTGKIEKIKLKNFKSFKNAVIPLSHGYTTIVGPNGSGKSNIVDGLCFAIGTTSMRNLRADKLVDLVNHDSEGSEAEVELLIKDHEGKSQVVSRTIDRQGTSVFRLNDRRTTKFHIDEMLGMINVHSSGHNIIMQGDVNRLIKMSPEQRRQIIDEVSGILEFEQKKEESLKELAKVEEKLKEATIILNERSNYLKQLEKEKLEAEVYLDLKNNQKTYLGTLAKKELESIEKSYTKSLDFLTKGKDKLAKLETEKTESQQRIRETSRKYEDINREIFEASAKKQESAQKEIAEVKTQIATLEEKVSNYRENIEKARKRRDESSKRMSNLALDVRAKEDTIKDLVEEEEKAKKEVQRIERELGVKSASSSEISKLYTELEEKNRQVDEKRERLYEVYTDIKTINETLNGKRGLIERLNSEIKRTEEKNKVMRTKFGALEIALESFDRIENEILSMPVPQNLADIIGRIKTELSSAKSVLKELRNTIFDLSPAAKEQEIQAILNEANALDILLTEKKSVSDKVNVELTKLNTDRLSIKKRFSEIGVEEKPLNLKKDEERLHKARDKATNVLIRRLSLRNEVDQILSSKKTELEKEVKESESEVTALDKERSKITEQRDSFLRVLKEKEAKAKEISDSASELFENKKVLERERDQLEDRLSECTKELDTLKYEMKDHEINKARHEVKFNELKQEVQKYQDVVPIDMSFIDLKSKIAETEKQLINIGNVNMKAIQMYDDYAKEISEIERKSDKLDEERTSIVNLIAEVEQKKLKAFTEAFDIINKHFDKYFRELYTEEGSTATIKLEDPNDPLNSGLVLEAKPRGKDLRNIDQLSGGEKTLTALAFLFAIQTFKPSPFYILDEIDAALDKENSERLARMIKKNSKELQFILVTHNPSVIRLSDQIIGVHMGKDGSSFVQVDLKDYQAPEQTTISA